MKIVTNTKGVVMPDDSHYYIMGANGSFFQMDTDWVKATIPVKQSEISDLEKVKEKVIWKLPPIPAATFQQIAGFFHLVAKKHHTEVGVLLHYNFKTRDWMVTVPGQTVTPAHVHYDAFERLPGYRCVGTMHSHVEMMAGHSGTDVQDEAEIDGLHVTIGRVHKFPELDLAAEIVIRGTRFTITPEKIIEGLSPLSDNEPEDEEEEKDSRWPNYSYYKNWTKWGTQSHVLTDKTVPNVPKDWWDKLRVKTWKSSVWKDRDDGSPYGSDDGYGSDFM